MKLYHYPKCSTCRKARKWLDENGHEDQYELIDLVEQTPSRDTIEAAWRASGLDLKKFFNTSGQSYRALDLKNTYAGLDDDQRLDLLAADGKLVKRPLLVFNDGDGVLVGFKDTTWADALS